MGIGAHDRLITIQMAAETQNSSGEMIPGAPEVLATVWAKKTPLGGEEGVAARQVHATAAYAWETVHYVPGITTKMQVNEGGVLFDINEVREIGRRVKSYLGTMQRGA